MKTQLILSSAVAGVNIVRAFRIAQNLKVSGLEVLAFRWTNPEKLAKLSERYNVAISGVHFPFWWETKSFREVLASEDDIKVKIAILMQQLAIGPGHVAHATVQLTKKFENAYLLIHPDVYTQLPNNMLLEGREVYFENERPKKGEPVLTYDPYSIQDALVKPRTLFHGHLMFDPRHIQIAQELGFLKKEPLHEMYSKLQPAGMHFSFRGEHINDLELPSREVWSNLAEAMRKNPPQYLTIEVGIHAEKKLERARKMIKENLGI